MNRIIKAKRLSEKKKGCGTEKKEKKKNSPTGNRTRVFWVTARDTDHYTIEDFRRRERTFIVLYPQ